MISLVVSSQNMCQFQFTMSKSPTRQVKEASQACLHIVFPEVIWKWTKPELGYDADCELPSSSHLAIDNPFESSAEVQQKLCTCWLKNAGLYSCYRCSLRCHVFRAFLSTSITAE